jgi:hypothetical protein
MQFSTIESGGSVGFLSATSLDIVSRLLRAKWAAPLLGGPGPISVTAQADFLFA